MQRCYKICEALEIYQCSLAVKACVNDRAFFSLKMYFIKIVVEFRNETAPPFTVDFLKHKVPIQKPHFSNKNSGVRRLDTRAANLTKADLADIGSQNSSLVYITFFTFMFARN